MTHLSQVLSAQVYPARIIRAKMASVVLAVLVYSALWAATPASAANNLVFSITPGTLYGNYEGSQYRDSLNGTSINIEGHAPNQWGMAINYERNDIQYLDGTPPYQQEAVLFSGYASNAPARSEGTYTTRLDYLCVRDRNGYDSANDVCVIAPQVSYLRSDKSRYFDVGYAISDYGTSPVLTTPLRVEQWTPTLGIAFNQSATHWLQLRGYFIHYSNPFRTLQKNQTTAYEAKYLYYPLSSYRLIPVYLEASVVTGERIYAVDRDTKTVSNLAELEKGGISFSAQWRLGSVLGLMISTSRTRFSEQTAVGENNYALRSTWLGLITRW